MSTSGLFESVLIKTIKLRIHYFLFRKICGHTEKNVISKNSFRVYAQNLKNEYFTTQKHNFAALCYVEECKNYQNRKRA